MILHPVSSMSVARLAARLLDDLSWAAISRVEAREIVARMEASSMFGPAPGSTAARLLDANARRLSALACAAYEADLLAVGGRDLSWLWDPAQLDAIHRVAYTY